LEWIGKPVYEYLCAAAKVCAKKIRKSMAEVSDEAT